MDEVPFDDRHIPRVEVEWERSTWWWRPLTRVIQPSVRASSLVVSALAMLLAWLGLQLGEAVFSPDWSSDLATTSQTRNIWTPAIVTTLMDAYVSVLSFRSFGVRELAFVTFLLVWIGTSFSLLGGVLARRAAVELGQQTIAPWGEAFWIVMGRWTSFMWAIGMHLVALLALLLPFYVLGWISSFGSIGGTIAGICLLIAFPLVFVVGRTLLSLVVCFPLSVTAISVEKKADAFEGFSRSNAYFFQRPFLCTLCALSCMFIGIVGEQIVSWVVSGGWSLMRTTFLSAGDTAPAANAYVNAGNTLAAWLVSGYWFSLFWAASAATYLIVRRSVDRTELDEIDTAESQQVADLPTIPPNASAAESTQSTDSPAAAESQPSESSPSQESAAPTGHETQTDGPESEDSN